MQHIRRLALPCQRHYAVRELAEELVGRLQSKAYLSEILAIYYWVLGNIRYANDPRNAELVRSPAEVLERLKRHVVALMQIATGAAKWKPSLDCDDLTCLLVGLFLCMGREVQVVTVAFHDNVAHGDRQYGHVYIRVREPLSGEWIVLDPVAAEGTAEMLRRVKFAKIWPVG